VKHTCYLSYRKKRQQMIPLHESNQKRNQRKATKIRTEAEINRILH